MQKTALKYLKMIKARTEAEDMNLVYFDLAHYLNIRNAQIKHLNWLKSNGCITIRKTKQVKKIVVGLTCNGGKYLDDLNQ